jgi:hypothetical protein
MRTTPTDKPDCTCLLTTLAIRLSLILLALASTTTRIYAQDEEFDSYKFRVGAFWFHSFPSGNFQSSGQRGSGLVDIDRDLGFSDFDTFAGKIDWRFARKHHLYFVVIPFNRSKQRMLTRPFTFQGETFETQLTTKAEMRAPLYAPGYQYDILRRRRGHLGIGIQFNLFDVDATITAAAQTVNGVPRPERRVSGSILAPIPVAGPEFRIYLTNSPRLFLDGNLYGMYFFGYGNFFSTEADLGVTLTRHLSAKAGYSLGSHLHVKSNATDRIGIRLTQQGSIVGLEYSF